MQIGEVIRKYRKSKNMTQEEMANRLGVTAPAVNKWENGNSYPDIMLLAPIARLLDVTLDILFSFYEELTPEEINSFVHEADNRLESQSYEEVFQWGKKKLEIYPNSEVLILRMAQFFDARRIINDIPNSEGYDDYLLDCYLRVLNSKDEEIRSTAADCLYSFYFRNEQYEKAEEYLSYFSNRNPERKRKQAEIYSKTNRMEEAYKAYEELLFTGCQMINMIFHSMYMLAMQEQNLEKAHIFVEKECQLAKLFEMGEYNEIAHVLDLATAEKDVDMTIETMEKMLATADGMCVFYKSPLYEHMIFQEPKAEFFAVLKRNLLECFRDEETYGFLKSEKRWQELVK